MVGRSDYLFEFGWWTPLWMEETEPILDRLSIYISMKHSLLQKSLKIDTGDNSIKYFFSVNDKKS